MNAKQYLARQIENLPPGMWSFVTALTNNRLQYVPSLDEHLTAPANNGYKATEYWLYADGTVLRKEIRYRNPHWAEVCEDPEQLISFSAGRYLLGDPEVSEQELHEGEYSGHINHTETRLDVLQRFWKCLGEERRREICAGL